MTVTTVATEYLLAIYTLAQEGKPVIGARLAERLRVTAPTVTQTLKRLIRDGLVGVEPRRGILLTPAGRSIAEEASRRQRLAERWLVEMLGLEWAEARGVSRTMAAAMTPPFAERLDAMLGHPTANAPGHLLVGAGTTGGLPPVVWPLDQVAPATEVVLERVADAGEQAGELLNFLDRHGLRPGVRFTVASVEPWTHTITLRRGEVEIVLGLRVAGQLWVRAVSEADLARAAVAEPRACPEDDTFVAEVESVASPCPVGHQIGDRFVFGQRTPCGMCGDAFVEIYPHLEELRTAASAGRSANLAVACPEHGNVTFRVRLAGSPAAGLAGEGLGA